MFKKNTASKSIVAMVFITSSFIVQAESYFGVNLTALEASADGIPDDATLTALSGRVGGYFNENFSGEVRVGTGINDDSFVGVDISLETMYGAYLRAGFAAGNFYPYAVVGYTDVELEFSGFGSSSESDTSFGLGVDITITDDIKGNAEYMNYYDKDGFELSGFSIGIAKLF